MVDVDPPSPPKREPKMRRGRAVRREDSKTTSREVGETRDLDALSRHPNFEMGEETWIGLASLSSTGTR